MEENRGYATCGTPCAPRRTPRTPAPPHEGIHSSLPRCRIPATQDSIKVSGSMNGGILTKRFRGMLQGSGDISGTDLQDCLELIVNIVGIMEERERKLVKSFNSVLENLYLLPASILGICTGVSGLFLIDSKIHMLFLVVIVIALGFCFSLAFPLRFAHRQLSRLKQHGTELASERNDLHLDFDRLKLHIRDDNLVMKKLTDFENQNEELRFVMLWYDRSLWLIGACGVVYIAVFVIAGFNVFCRHSG